MCNNIVNFCKDMLVHLFLNASLCKNTRRVLCINSTLICSCGLGTSLLFQYGKNMVDSPVYGDGMHVTMWQNFTLKMQICSKTCLLFCYTLISTE